MKKTFIPTLGASLILASFSLDTKNQQILDKNKDSIFDENINIPSSLAGYTSEQSITPLFSKMLDNYEENNAFASLYSELNNIAKSNIIVDISKSNDTYKDLHLSELENDDSNFSVSPILSGNFNNMLDMEQIIRNYSKDIYGSKEKPSQKYDISNLKIDISMINTSLNIDSVKNINLEDTYFVSDDLLNLYK